MPRQTMLEASPLVADDLNAGLDLHIRGHYSAAVHRYCRALNRAPGSALGRYLLGLALMARGDAVSAYTEWEAATRSKDAGPQTVWARDHARTLLDQA